MPPWSYPALAFYSPGVLTQPQNPIQGHVLSYIKQGRHGHLVCQSQRGPKIEAITCGGQGGATCEWHSCGGLKERSVGGEASGGGGKGQEASPRCRGMGGASPM